MSKKMKFDVIVRDWKETFKDIKEMYDEVTSEYSDYEEREISVDDGYFIFISDSKDIHKMSVDELIELWEEYMELV